MRLGIVVARAQKPTRPRAASEALVKLLSSLRYRIGPATASLHCYRATTTGTFTSNLILYEARGSSFRLPIEALMVFENED